MKEIVLFSGEIALVDDEDFDLINAYKWYRSKRKRVTYAIANVRKKTIYMHKVITHTDNSQKIDHKNHDGLDNRKENLRLTTGTNNQANRRKTDSSTSSSYKGLHYDKEHNCYIAKIVYQNTYIYLGSFSNEIAAAKAYDEAAKQIYKEFALINNVECENFTQYMLVRTRESKYKNVTRTRNKKNPWVATLRYKGKSHHVGVYTTEEAANEGLEQFKRDHH